jgi:hypothetical protein
MGGEVGAIESCRQGDDLLGRVASSLDHDVVVADGLRERSRYRAHDPARIELELLSADLYCPRRHCISTLYSLMCLCRQ